MFRRHVLGDLSSYIDNQLSESRKQKVEAHLTECKLCSLELSKLKLLSEKIKIWQVPNLGSNFEGSVSNEIVQEELERGVVKMKKKTLTILIPSGVIAGILVFLFVGNVYFKHGVTGRVRALSDEIGDQYSPETVSSTLNRKSYRASSGSSLGGSYLTTRAERNQTLTRAERNQPLEYSGDAGTMQSFETGYMKDTAGATTQLPITLGATTQLPYAPNKVGSWLTEQYTPAGEGSVIVIQPVLPATGEGEKIIRTAQVVLETQDGKEAYKRANEICKELGGYLSSSNFYKDKAGRESGTITMRIPKEKFLTALDKLAALGKVENSFTDSRDVGQEYANLKSRLDAAMVVYNKMLEALQKRQVTIPEAVRLESELTPVLRRIEDLKNQIESLNNAVSFTTITVNFHEPSASANALKQAREDIRQSMLTAQINGVKLFAKIIQDLPSIILLVIWIAVILGAAILAKYWIVRIFKRG
jgi:hypothetical protein